MFTFSNFNGTGFHRSIQFISKGVVLPPCTKRDPTWLADTSPTYFAQSGMRFLSKWAFYSDLGPQCVCNDQFVAGRHIGLTTLPDRISAFLLSTSSATRRLSSYARKLCPVPFDRTFKHSKLGESTHPSSLQTARADNFLPSQWMHFTPLKSKVKLQCFVLDVQNYFWSWLQTRPTLENGA